MPLYPGTIPYRIVLLELCCPGQLPAFRIGQSQFQRKAGKITDFMAISRSSLTLLFISLSLLLSDKKLESAGLLQRLQESHSECESLQRQLLTAEDRCSRLNQQLTLVRVPSSCLFFFLLAR